MTSGASTTRIEKNNPIRIDNSFTAGDPSHQAYGNVNGSQVWDQEQEKFKPGSQLKHPQKSDDVKNLDDILEIKKYHSTKPYRSKHSNRDETGAAEPMHTALQIDKIVINR